MITTKTVNGVQYWLRPTAAKSCDGCAALGDYQLCSQLGGRLRGDCHEGVWCNTDTVPQYSPRVNPGTKKHNEVTLAINNYQQLAQAIQQAGGCIEILETHTGPQLLETLARNNITLQATYDH